MSSRARAYSLAVLFGINILNFYDRNVLGPLAEPIRREFRLSDAQLGALATLFTIIYAVVGLPIGRIADTWSRKRLLAWGVAVWTALTATAGLATSYGMLLVSRLGVGVGEAVCAPAATSWIGDLFPARQRSRALALFMLGVPLGAMFGNALTGPVAQAHGWRFALVLAATPAFIVIPALLGIREPARGTSESHPLTGPLPSAWSLLRLPTLWWIIASGALINFNLYALATFLPAFLTRYHGLPVGTAGLWSGLGYGAGGVFGGLAAGIIGDAIIGKRQNGRMLAASGSALLAAPASWLALLAPAGSALDAVLLMMAAYGLLNMYYGLVYSSIHDIVAPQLRGTAMAVYFTAMYLCGASFGPVITGGLSDYFARQAAAAGAAAETARAVGLHQAMYVIPALSAALAVVLWAGSRTIAADMARRSKAALLSAAR